MEIIVGNRLIDLDSLEVLSLEERTALSLEERTALDPAAKSTIREEIQRIFRERREAMAEPQKFQFTVAPMDLVGNSQAMMFMRDMGIWDGKSQDLSAQVFSLAIFLMQIKDWQGFEAGGEPLPCTQENKVLVFGQAPLVIQAALEKLQVQEEAERKNCKTSRAG